MSQIFPRVRLRIKTLFPPQTCTAPAPVEGETVDPLKHTCLFTLTRVSKNTGTYQCVALYDSKLKFKSNESKSLEVVKLTALSGNVYFTTDQSQSRTLVATVETPTFPSESYFNLVT